LIKKTTKTNPIADGSQFHFPKQEYCGKKACTPKRIISAVIVHKYMIKNTKLSPKRSMSQREGRLNNGRKRGYPRTFDFSAKYQPTVPFSYNPYFPSFITI
jgi:hypothetical protein